MAQQSRWTYTFTDLLTGAEVATLPMVGVSFDQKLLDVGQASGVVPTTDPAVRAMNPWAATAPRRTGLVIEQDGVPVWDGLVLGRVRDQDTYGLKITAATWEAWLAQAYLRANVDLRGAQFGAPSTFNTLVATVQSYPNGGVGLQVGSNTYPWTIGQGGDGTGENRVAGQLYPATDLKTVADYLKGWAAQWGAPIEWRVDVARNTSGAGRNAYTHTLLVTEGTLADGRAGLTLHYPGELLGFTDTEDGTTEANAVLGGASGAVNTKLLSVATADQLGSDEFTAGYPLWSATYSVGGSSINQATLDATVQAKLLDKLVQGHTIDGLTLRPDAVPLSSYAVGDAVTLGLTHPAYPEWPGETVYTGYRITGRSVTVGSGNAADSVKLDVVPPGGRLPASVAFTATIANLLARVKALEVASPTGASA